MTTLQNELDDLRAIWARRDASLATDFEVRLAAVAAFGDASCIGSLLQLFEDEPPHDELLFSVVHSVEAFPDEVYLSELLRATPALLRTSPRWARILYLRVLNAPAVRAKLASAVGHWATPERIAVKSILDDIESGRSDFAAKVEEVRRRL